MATPAGAAPLVAGALQFPLLAVLPARFRLGFAYDRACVQRVHRPHAARFVQLGDSVDVDVHQLLAAAPLRHFGAPYDLAYATLKEIALWAGWLGTRPGGKLLIASLPSPAINTGRLVELASSLGECVALDLALALFGAPLAFYRRIPENADGMDFLLPTPSGDLAIEAKAGHGSCVGKNRQDISDQMARQPAREKFGIVLCYQRDNYPQLKNKGSYVHVVDPPGRRHTPEAPLRSVFEHYLQISMTIGIWPLANELALALGRPVLQPAQQVQDRRRLQAIRVLRLPEDGTPEEKRLIVVLAARFAANGVRIRGEIYIGRMFDAGEVLRARLPPGLSIDSSSVRPFVFFGLALSVIQAIGNVLIEDTPEHVNALLSLVTSEQRLTRSFHLDRQGALGPITYTGLEDGLLRVDLASFQRVLDEDLLVD